MSKNNNFLVINKQHIIHYYYKESKNSFPTLVFLHGYYSDINTKKALFLKEFCKNSNLGFLMLEYRGHGKSSGNIFKFNVKSWFNDVITVINNFTKNKSKILIGSSLGGWLSFLYALNFPKFIKAVIGIAPAVDFTEVLKTHPERLINDPNDENKFLIKHKNGGFTVIHKNLLNTPQDLILLNRPVINLDMPIRILHGMKDDIVNYQTSLEFSEKLSSEDVNILLIKEGNHTLSTEKDLNRLGNVVEDIL